MILLCGLPGDRPLDAVCEALQRQKSQVIVYDQRDVLQTEIQLDVDCVVRGFLRSPSTFVDFSEVTAAYLRLYDSRQFPAIARAGPGSSEWNHALQVDDCLWSWAQLADEKIVNRPSAMVSNSSKPFQAEIIRESGFCIPDTLITTDPEAVREFQAHWGEVIYKSISGVRSIVSRLKAEDYSRLEEIAWCPTQFQQYVRGVDYRIHVIGDEVFACEIQTKADDYRYASRQGIDVSMIPAELSLECLERCQHLARQLGLLFAGIDLRRSEDGDWYCFEVNPSPAFTYYQAETGQPIDEAVAQFLAA